MTLGWMVETPRCIVCRACQVARKQSTGLKAEETTVQLRGTGIITDNSV